MTTQQTSPQKTAKHRRGSGIQRFAKACSRALRDSDDEIAAALFRRAADGNIAAARLLLKVLEKHPSTRIHKKRFASGKKALLEALAKLQWIVTDPSQVRKPSGCSDRNP